MPNLESKLTADIACNNPKMGKPDSHHKVVELKKRSWTPEEDQKLLAYIKEHGHGSWCALPSKAGLQRSGKSCRLRWTNYLRPDIKRGKFSSQEDMAIIRLHALLGNRWSVIATLLPKRTDNEIKNYWNSRLKKLLTRQGIDPVTHKPKNGSGELGQSKRAAIVSHLAQWETARLEAEARLAHGCKHMSSKLDRAQIPTPRPPCLDVLKVWQAAGYSNSFFGSPAGSPELPASGLNGVVSMSSYNFGWVGQEKGKKENPVQVLYCNHFSGVEYGCNNNNLQGSTDHLQLSCDYCNNSRMTGVDDGGFQENKDNWNELLDIVSSAAESPPV